MFDPDKLTWRCDACGDIRPDTKISVLSIKGQLTDATRKDSLPVEYTRNWKYCRDRDTCFTTVESRGAQL